MRFRVPKLSRKAVRCFALIALSFFLTSSGYLSWLYHLMSMVSHGCSDLLSMSAGYAAQAAGILLLSTLIRKDAGLISGKLYGGMLGAFIACLIPSMLSAGAAGTIVFGILLNVCCGLIAGYYLYVLSLYADASCQGRVFGYGYAAAALLTWLFSITGGGGFLRSGYSLLLYIPTAGACAYLGFLPTGNEAEDEVDADARKRSAKTARDSGKEGGKAAGQKTGRNAGIRPVNRLTSRSLALIGCTLFLICLVKNLGFGFPSADVHSGISIELSRLVYAAGLIAAGHVNDRSRKGGAVCTLIALITPFIMLTLEGESVPHIILWNLDYLIYGFFSVYRVLLFTDLAGSQDMPFLAPLGLAIGRMGEASGNLTELLLRGHTTVLVLLAACLFAVTVVLFIRMYQDLYIPFAVQKKTDREIFEHFAVRHDLSVREKEVLRYLLDGYTNAEIAGKLFVSESTVKFHVHNLLQKTGCSGRAQLRSAYLEQK